MPVNPASLHSPHGPFPATAGLFSSELSGGCNGRCVRWEGALFQPPKHKADLSPSPHTAWATPESPDTGCTSGSALLGGSGSHNPETRAAEQQDLRLNSREGGTQCCQSRPHPIHLGADRTQPLVLASLTHFLSSGPRSVCLGAALEGNRQGMRTG